MPVVTEALGMNDGQWKTGKVSYKRVGAGRRRVIVYGPTRRSQVASTLNRAIHSWNWTVAVAVAFFIALMVTSALGSHSTDPAVSSGLASHQTQGRDVMHFTN
jgi:hypothetical protein